jgi:F-type H+-transporting ATPase subunit b
MNVLSTVLLSGSMIDLDPTIFVQAGIFFVALGVLYVLVFGPMIRLFEAREEAIDGAKVEAQRLQAEASNAGHSFDEQMRTVRRESQEERDRLRKDGQKLEAKLLEKVEHETEQLLAEASQRMVDEKAVLRAELRARAPELATQIAGKLLNREVR